MNITAEHFPQFTLICAPGICPLFKKENHSVTENWSTKTLEIIFNTVWLGWSRVMLPSIWAKLDRGIWKIRTLDSCPDEKLISQTGVKFPNSNIYNGKTNIQVPLFTSFMPVVLGFIFTYHCLWTQLFWLGCWVSNQDANTTCLLGFVNFRH